MFIRKTSLRVLFRRLTAVFTVLLTLVISQLVAAEDPLSKPVVLSGQVSQGGLVVGRILPDEKVFVEGLQLATTDEGIFLLGLGRKADEIIELTIVGQDGSASLHQLPVAQRTYRVQKIEGVPQRTVTPDEKDLARIQRDALMVKQSRQLVSSRTDFLSGFVRPLNGPVTGVYGSQRVYNGVPGSPHYGIDYAAPTGTLVAAPAPGRVIFAHPDLFYSGGTLIIDHGFGLSSTFLHLSEILVTKGDEVARGESIAKVGATGRATGPHLDWRMNWRDVRVDPQLVLKALPAG